MGTAGRESHSSATTRVRVRGATRHHLGESWGTVEDEGVGRATRLLRCPPLANTGRESTAHSLPPSQASLVPECTRLFIISSHGSQDHLETRPNCSRSGSLGVSMDAEDEVEDEKEQVNEDDD